MFPASNHNLIFTLTPNDVILGRGLGASQYPGSQQLLSIVSKHKTIYRSTNREGKHTIACSIVDHIRDKLGGRFVKEVLELRRQGRRVWVEIPYEAAVEKTKQALRERTTNRNAGDSSMESPIVAIEASSRRSNRRNDQSSVRAVNQPDALAAAQQQQQFLLQQLRAASLPLLPPAAVPPQALLNAGALPLVPPYAAIPPAPPLVQAPLLDPAVYASMVPSAAAAAVPPIHDPLVQEFCVLANSFVQQASDIFQSLAERRTYASNQDTSAQETEEDTTQGERRTYAFNQDISTQEDESTEQETTQVAAARSKRSLEEESAPNFARLPGMAQSNDSVAQKTENPGNLVPDLETSAVVAEELWSMLDDDPDVPRFTREQEEYERAHLSEEEQEAALADLFGNMCDIGGPSTKRAKNVSVESLLKEMRDEIDGMAPITKAALMEAQKRASATEFSDERMELFLRRDDMDARVAARRFVRYWDKRWEWFGSEKFHLPMTQAGAFRDGHVALECGAVGLLSHLDSSGRLIGFVQPRLNTFECYTSEDLLRATWYLFEVASQHPNITRGMVMLVWGVGATIWNFDRRATAIKGMIELEREAWPVRVCAAHVYHPQSVLVNQILRPLVLARMDKSFRCRLVFHDIPQENFITTMACYGMSEDVLPKDIGGKANHDHAKWLADRRKLEEED